MWSNPLCNVGLWWCVAAGYRSCHAAMTCLVLSGLVCQLLYCFSVLAFTLSLEQITELRTSCSVFVRSSCGQRWKIIPHRGTTEVLLLSLLLWMEIWEADRNARGLGHGWALNGSVDRPVRLVLIPVHAYNCFSFTMCVVVKTGMLVCLQHVRFSPECCFQGLNLVKQILLPLLKLQKKKSLPTLLQYSTSFASQPGNLFPPCEFLLCSAREEWGHCSVNQRLPLLDSNDFINK